MWDNCLRLEKLAKFNDLKKLLHEVKETAESIGAEIWVGEVDEYLKIVQIHESNMQKMNNLGPQILNAQVQKNHRQMALLYGDRGSLRMYF
jgi:hypothetical protein